VPVVKAIDNYKTLILGAVGEVEGKLQALMGRYTPEQFGRITLWQMRNLFGFQEKGKPLTDKEAFWLSCRSRGMSEFDIRHQWITVKIPELAAAEEIRREQGNLSINRSRTRR
jgi:hypothetical protein